MRPICGGITTKLKFYFSLKEASYPDQNKYYSVSFLLSHFSKVLAELIFFRVARDLLACVNLDTEEVHCARH